MWFKNLISKIGFANFFSLLSMLISLTCFAMLARISSEYTQSKLQNQRPRVIIGEGGEVKVDRRSDAMNSAAYDGILSDIDKIVDQTPDRKIKDGSIVENAAVEESSDPENADGATAEVAVVRNHKVEPSVVSDRSGDIDEFKDFYKAQVATFDSHGDALAYWFKTRKNNKPYLDDVRYSVDKFVVDGKELFRLRLVSRDKEEIEKHCALLKKNRINCFVV